jgi:predicted phosphate transport protein (TIGR00153 family)
MGYNFNNMSSVYIFIGSDGMFSLKPKEDKFYKLFLEAAEIVNEGAILLRHSLDNLQDKELNVSKIEVLEHKGDRLVNIVVKELSESFITPIDREDIYSLIKKLDDVLDLTNSTMHRFLMYDITKSTEEAKLFADMIVECTQHILELMRGLNSVANKAQWIREKILCIHDIESKADRLFRKTVSELFKNEPNPIEIIKWKEIYQILENTMDKCEKISNTVEGVVIKNA